MNKVFSILFVIYKNTLSRILEMLFGKGCIYSPTCSEYANQAILRYGFIKGFRLFFKRLLKCHPFRGKDHEYYDPVT